MNEERKKRALILTAFAVVATLSFFSFSFKISYAQSYEQPSTQNSTTFSNASSFQWGQTITDFLTTQTEFKISAIELALDKTSEQGSSILSCSYDGAGESCFLEATSTISSGDFNSGGTPFAPYSYSDIGNTRYVLFKPCDTAIGGVGAACTFGETNKSTVNITVPIGEKLMLWSGNNGFSSKAYGSTNSSSYSNGFAFSNAAATPLVQTSETTKDVYFKIWLENDGTPLTTGSIILTYPQNGSAVQDFPFWNVEYNVLATSTGIFTKGVRYGTTTEMNLDDNEPIYLLNASSSIQKYDNLPTPVGDYYAQAYISTRYCNSFPSDCGDYDVATSSISQFTLLSSGDVHFPTYEELQPNATTTGNIFEQCEQILGSGNSFLNFWGAGFCKGTRFLFEPHQISYTAISDTVALYKTIFPFSIFFGLSDTIKDQLEIAKNDTAGTLTWTPTIIGTSQSLTILSPTTLEDFVGTTIKDFIFLLMATVVWLGVAYKVVRHFI